ncbi:WD repeat-containing protein 18 [Malaya genurostris]|uniref:WD repeat-containing protein 18 n=1 Tax=Malaya genurostris TaxID=325434 RepID=UPI0026F3A09A|nr:WD repeat-containing protein 18 [Malaya genurostris]
MSDCVEVAISSDSSDQLWSCCAWDVRSGTHLITYKGGGAPGPHTLGIINNQFIVTGNMVKPMLHIWPINQHEMVSTRFVLSGRPTAIAVSPDGNYCIVAVQEAIYVYQLATGALLATVSCHYQAVTVIRFTDNGSHFISAGMDGMAHVWCLAQVVRVFQKHTINALYSYSDHALPITDLYIGKGGMKALFCTVSIDRTCKIYDLVSGSILLNLVFQEPLSSVTIDGLESNIFVGTCSGPILKFDILATPRLKDYHVDNNQQQKNSFLGHKKEVSCLSVSIDNDTLLSGSADERVIIWHIKSRQQLRIIPHKGIVTNAQFMLAPKSMFNQMIKINPSFQPLQKLVCPVEKIIDQCVEVAVHEKCYKKINRFKKSGTCTYKNNTTVNNQEEIIKLKKEIHHLKMVNREMYDFTVKNIMKEN